MRDAFGRFIANILLVVLVMLIPIGFLVIKTEKAKEVYARETVERFYEEIMENGEVTVEEWEKMLRDLERNGVLYDIEVSVGKPGEWYNDK